MASYSNHINSSNNREVDGLKKIDLFSILDDQFVIENFQHQIKQDEAASISVLEETKQAVQCCDKL